MLMPPVRRHSSLLLWMAIISASYTLIALQPTLTAGVFTAGLDRALEWLRRQLQGRDIHSLAPEGRFWKAKD